MEKRKGLPRALLVYLAAIVAPALGLLYLGLGSVERQQEAVRTLADSNRMLGNEKVAAEVEARVRRLAEACLRQQPRPPFQRGHHIVEHYFVLQDGRVVYPRQHVPPPRPPGNLPPVFAEAEEMELRRDDSASALDNYRTAYEQARGEDGRALALSRVARCLKKLGRHEEAAQAWRLLIDRHASARDPSHRPYVLTARFERNETQGLYEDLIQNRWDLAAEQFDFYMARLGRAAPPGHRFALARELDEHFRHAGPLRDGELYTFRLPGFQTYYRLAGDAIFGFSVRSPWVKEHLEAQVRADLRLPADPVEDDELWIHSGATGLVLALLLLGVVLVVRDVTREARMNQLRAEFVSGVSHELKTPLTLIRLYAETLLLKEYPAAERRGFYEIITRESERLSHLIQKVLSFSRIERGEKQYLLVEGDLGAAVGRTVEVYRPYLEKAGFQVETTLAGPLPPVCFDPDAVSQAVVNLLDNAVKYSGDGKYVGVRLYRENGSVVFAVQDRGVGVSDSEKGKIFERFYRSANGTAIGGYGLGLYLVKHIMEAHGGHVQVDSESGRGCCFRLIFPLAS